MCSSKLNKVIAYAPGKFMLAGEWAVLELGNSCVVVASDRGIHVKVWSIPRYEREKSVFVRMATEIAQKYLEKLKPCSIEISSEIDGMGLGSSAAVVVAVISGLLKFNSVSVSKIITFKLSCIAHFLAQNKAGSGFDVAASTYQQALVYKRFDPVWLESELQKCSIKEIVEKKWPYLEIRPIELPDEMKVVVTNVGYKMLTTGLIEKVMRAKAENRVDYDLICDEIASVVEKLVVAIESADKEKILELIRLNRVLLLRFESLIGVDLETAEIKKICDDVEAMGGAAKFSGAGGGDCCVSVKF